MNPDPSDYIEGSFRDRNGRVFLSDGEVYRAVSAQALEEALSETEFFRRLVAVWRGFPLAKGAARTSFSVWP